MKIKITFEIKKSHFNKVIGDSTATKVKGSLKRSITALLSILRNDKWVYPNIRNFKVEVMK